MKHGHGKHSRQAAIDLTDESKGIYGFASHIGTETGYWPFIYQNGEKYLPMTIQNQV